MKRHDNGAGSFEFDARNGDLVDATGSAATGNGPDWLAFSHDCQQHPAQSR